MAILISPNFNNIVRKNREMQNDGYGLIFYGICLACEVSLHRNNTKFCSRKCANGYNKTNAKYTHSQIANMIERYTNGESTVSISKIYDTEPKTINSILRRNNILIRSNSEYSGMMFHGHQNRHDSKYDYLDREQIVILYKNDNSIDDIAKILNITFYGAYEILKRAGVKFRKGAPGEKNYFYGKRGAAAPGFKEPFLRKQTIYMAIRGCSKYSEWREGVFRRDNYTCVICGDNRGGNLNADHIVPFSVILSKNNINKLEDSFECKELWSLENGRTLCIECHKKTDTWGVKAKKLLRGLGK